MKVVIKHAKNILFLLLFLIAIVLIATICVKTYRLNVALEQLEQFNIMQNGEKLNILELKQNSIAILCEFVILVITAFMSICVEHFSNSMLDISVSNVEIHKCYHESKCSTQSICFLCNKNEKVAKYSNLADIKYKIIIHLDERKKGQINNVFVDHMELKFCNNDESFVLKPAMQCKRDDVTTVLEVNERSAFEVTEIDNSLVFLSFFNIDINDDFTNKLSINQNNVNINLTLYVNSEKNRFIKTRLDYKQSISILDFNAQYVGG